MKRIGKYLQMFPRLGWKFDKHETVDHMEMFTDADSAGCRPSRKSTSGGAAMTGGHCIKAWSKTQAVLAKS